MANSDNNAPWNGRAIILLDLDAFFASVEQLDHPAWRGKPVIVGGSPEKRGVVSTCSYEARVFGVHSAMPSVTAKKLCPQAIWTSGNYARYREMSDKVMEIMRAESPFLQQVSIDEAFLDVTPSSFNPENPVSIAQRIQEQVSKLGINCSIGLGASKSVAKVASDFEKPRGLTVVYPGREEAFLSPLPTKAMSGIGKVAQDKLRLLGIHTLGDVASASEETLAQVFGINSTVMRLRCQGKDTDPVEDIETIKSLSHEVSFAKDLVDYSDIYSALESVAALVARRLRLKKLGCKGIVLKVRYSNRQIRSATAKLSVASNTLESFKPHLQLLLDELWHEGIPLRLVGVAAIHLTDDFSEQLSLFQNEHSPNESGKMNRTAALDQATDALRDRFGENAVLYGRDIKTMQNLTGSSAKNPADYS